MLTYHASSFDLRYDEDAGVVVTCYADGTWTGGTIVLDDAFHAKRLGMSSLEHRLHHELAHHVVGMARGYEGSERGCRVLWADAHQQMQRDDAHVDEWYITAVQYAARGCELPTPEHYGALLDLARIGDVPALLQRFAWLFDARYYTTSVGLTAS